VLAAGLAITDAPVFVLSDAAGDHEYVLAPDALRLEVAPLQIVPVPVVLTVGFAFTVTAITLVDEQPLLVPVTL
jgi:hypothetical protein